MNRNAAIFQLDELSVHINEIIAEIKNGDYDEEGELSYLTGLQHLMDHLVNAWHYSRMTDEKINALTQEEFDKLTLSIPRLNLMHKLVEPDDDIV